MRAHCLCKEELNRLVEIELEGKDLYEEEFNFQCLLDDWRCWDVEFMCLATCLSQILEQRLKRGVDARPILSGIYSLSERAGLFTVEGFGEDFVAYMLRHVRQGELSIEENLVQIRNLLSEHVYQ